MTFRERLRHLVTPGGIYLPVYIKDGSYNRKHFHKRQRSTKDMWEKTRREHKPGLERGGE